MQTIYIILGLIIVVSFIIGFIKTIWDNSKISKMKRNSVADDPKIIFDIKDDEKDKDDVELL